MTTTTESRYIRIEAAYFWTTEEVIARHINERVIAQMKAHAQRDQTKVAYTHIWVPLQGRREEHHHLVRYEAQYDRWSAKVVGKRFF